MDEEDRAEAAPSAEEVEFSQTVGRYDEVLSKCKLVRARLLMTAANFSESGNDQSDSSDILESITKLEEQVHRLSVQEEMLKGIKISQLTLNLLSTDGPYDGLDVLLKEHSANQALLFELSKNIKEEKLAQKKIIEQLLNQLCEYTASLKNDQVKLDGTSTSDSSSNLQMMKAMEKQIKEIRFMQICISQIISHSKVDLRESDSLREILKSARTPITSVDNFC